MTCFASKHLSLTADKANCRAKGLSCLYAFKQGVPLIFFSTFRNISLSETAHLHLRITLWCLQLQKFFAMFIILAMNIFLSEKKSSRQTAVYFAREHLFKAIPNFGCLAVNHVMFALN